MRLLRRLLTALAISVALVICSAVATYQLVSDRLLAGWIIDPIAAALDYDISAAGGIKIKRGLAPTLYASELSIRDRAGSGRVIGAGTHELDNLAAAHSCPLDDRV